MPTDRSSGGVPRFTRGRVSLGMFQRLRADIGLQTSVSDPPHVGAKVKADILNRLKIEE